MKNERIKNMNFKSLFHGKSGSIITCILEIVVGVLLLINPVGFTSGIIMGAGVLLCLGGAGSIVRYFMVKPEVAAQKQLLFKGVLAMMTGAVCITKYDWFLTAFPLLTVLYAVAMLVLRSAGVAYYLPVLVFSGTLAGVAIGAVGAVMVKRIRFS